jgi:hypothetical protein
MEQRFWQAVLITVFTAGICAFLTPVEEAIARTWMEMVLGRFREMLPIRRRCHRVG